MEENGVIETLRVTAPLGSNQLCHLDGTLHFIYQGLKPIANNTATVRPIIPKIIFNSLFILPLHYIWKTYMDSNHDYKDQNLGCYHYTIGPSFYLVLPTGLAPAHLTARVSKTRMSTVPSREHNLN